MQFNKFVWELYKQSPRGRAAIKRFSRLGAMPIGGDGSPDSPDDLIEDNVLSYVAESVRRLASEQLVANQEQANDCFGMLVESGGFIFEPLGDQGYENWYDYIAGVSAGLCAAHPDFFLPYKFRTRFNRLEEIHAEFGIPLPPAPGKSSKQLRAVYYAPINEAWQGFRRQHGMSPAEMCAFLYDFTRQFTSPLDATDLPAPSKAWLATGGAAGKQDFDWLGQATKASVSQWGGNKNVRRGDIILMHKVSPLSKIDSIWRACSDGFTDPFFHYHSQIWICDPIKTAPVTFAEIKQHPLLSKKSAVTANFQGPSSKTSFTLEEYQAILGIMASKGQDISLLPMIPASVGLPDKDIFDERDVETELIEPLLKRLGYDENQDWTRQLRVRLGRRDRGIPDYVIGHRAGGVAKGNSSSGSGSSGSSRGIRGNGTAKMVVEAKYRIGSDEELSEAFTQANSYATLLQCNLVVAAALDGIWIFDSGASGLGKRQAVHRHWNDLGNPDVLHEVSQLIGKKSVFGRGGNR